MCSTSCCRRHSLLRSSWNGHPQQLVSNRLCKPSSYAIMMQQRPICRVLGSAVYGVQHRIQTSRSWNVQQLVRASILTPAFAWLHAGRTGRALRRFGFSGWVRGIMKHVAELSSLPMSAQVQHLALLSPLVRTFGATCNLIITEAASRRLM